MNPCTPNVSSSDTATQDAEPVFSKILKFSAA
jgi:hypothetical protein